EFSSQIAQSRGNYLWVAMRRSTRPVQPGLATLQWYVAVRSGDSPLGNQRTLPAGIHIELLHNDKHSCLNLVASPIVEINAVRGQQPGQVGRQCPLEALVQSFGP